MEHIMAVIADTMDSIGLAYDYEEFMGEVEYPYWVGHYQEVEPTEESGMQEADFLLTGTTRGTWLALQKEANKIRAAFHPVSGKTGTTEDGTGYAIWYASATTVPTDTESLKRIEITLKTKIWRVD